MKLSEEVIELYKVLSELSGNSIYSTRLPDKFRPHDNTSINTLCTLELISHQVNPRRVIIKHHEFFESLRFGGIENWMEIQENNRRIEDELKEKQNKLIDSSLSLNKHTKRSLFVSWFIGSITLLVLIVQFINILIENKKEKQLYNSLEIEINNLNEEQLLLKEKLYHFQMDNDTTKLDVD